MTMRTAAESVEQFRELKRQCDLIHAEGLARPQEGNYQALNVLIDRERAVVNELGTLIVDTVERNKEAATRAGLVASRYSHSRSPGSS